MSIYAGIKYKISCKLLVFWYLYLNTFIWRIIKRIILCKKIIQFYLKKEMTFISYLAKRTIWLKYVPLETVTLSFETFFYIIKNKRDISDSRFKWTTLYTYNALEIRFQSQCKIVQHSRAAYKSNGMKKKWSWRYIMY